MSRPDWWTPEHDFVAWVLQCGVLKFGEFKLKSGRLSPYFFNAGLFNDGALLGTFASHYATCCMQIPNLVDKMLYGPAYKGIPLATATAIRLDDDHGVIVPWAFNRKEEKDHGEGKLIVGTPINGNVCIVDDVITAGTAVRESVEIIRAQGGNPTDLVIALDRQEKGSGTDMSAVQQVERAFGLQVHPIATFATIVDLLEHDEGAIPDAETNLRLMQDYRDLYGIT